MAETQVFDPFQAASNAATAPSIVDPFAPGYEPLPGAVARGFKSALKGAKSTVGGVVAAAGDAVGSKDLRQYGLDVAAKASAEAAPLAIPVESVTDAGSAAEFLKYGVGYAGGNLMTVLASGLLGRLGGTALARGVPGAAEKLMLKNAGMTAGLVGSGIAQEVGSIYPEAVEAGVPDALARSVVGGVAAGSLDFLPQVYLASKLGLFGKTGAASTGKGAFDIAGRVAKEGAKTGALEGLTELGQTAIERTFAGQSLDSPEAISDYANSAALGVVGGGVAGGVVGAIPSPAATPAPSAQPPGAPPAAPEPIPAPSPLPPEIDPGLMGPPPPTFAQMSPDGLATEINTAKLALVDTSPSPATDAEKALIEAGDRHEELTARLTALETEASLPKNKRRASVEISADREAASGEIAALQSRIKALKLEIATPAPEKTSLPDPVVLGAPDPAPDAPVIETVSPPPRSSDPAVQIASIKRARGLLLSSDEAKALREFEAKTPGIIVEPSRARETFKQLDSREKKEAFVGAYHSAVDEVLQQAVAEGALKEATAKSMGRVLRQGADEAVGKPTAAEGSITFNAAFDKALKGKLRAEDRETFRAKLSAAVQSRLPKEIAEPGDKPLKSVAVEKKGAPAEGEQLTLLSKAASDWTVLDGAAGTLRTREDAQRIIDMRTKGNSVVRPSEAWAGYEFRVVPDAGHFLIEGRKSALFSKAARKPLDTGKISFQHWGNVPTGYTDPNAMGTGVRGADWPLAAKAGLKYTSAVKYGSDYMEGKVVSRKPYVGVLDAAKIYPARSDDPLLAQTREEIREVHGPDNGMAWQMYTKKVRDLGYDAMEYADGHLRLFKPSKVYPALTQDRAADLAAKVLAVHEAHGGASVNLVTGQDLAGSQNYAVSPYKDREVTVEGALTKDTLTAYIQANEDLLGDPQHMLGTWFNEDDGKTYLDVAAPIQHMHDAMRLAREHNQIAIFDLRTFTEIKLSHPLFDAAQMYNASVGLPPIQDVPYIEFDPVVGQQIARAYDRLQPVNPDPRVKAAYDALAAEEEQQFAALSKIIKIEAWPNSGQPYANSAEMRADVFGNSHLWVFPGGDPHPYRTAEQTFRGRAVHDLFAHARTGFEFGARGELNATRIHAQMYSEAALPALIVDNIGQNAWVNFSDANAALPAAQRAFAEQKVDLLPESVWASLLEAPRAKRSRAAARLDSIYTGKGERALAYLESILGTPERLTANVVGSVDGGVGRIRLGTARDIIELSIASKDIQSVAAHEGFHYLEHRVFTAAERAIVARAFATGSSMHTELLEKAKAYDRTNGTNIADEVRSVPAEARAYAFEFWTRGEFQPDGVVERVFVKLRALLEKIANYIAGLGFQSHEDIFKAIERGHYARQELKGFRGDVMGASYIQSIEPDALPDGATLNRGAASTGKGRPGWVKTPADVRKLRKLLGALTAEGDGAANWYRRSSAAILRWAEGDTQKAARLASLVAMYSPRTPVGEDLRKAVTHYTQWEKGQPINAGGTRFQNEYGTKVLNGTGHIDYSGKYSLPGNPDSAPKVNSFFKNMMFQIDPVTYGRETQDSTIDMWMSHIFGFGNKDGKLTDANYWWADAEIKKIARDRGVDPDQVQAAIWVAIKARGNLVRNAARKEGIANGWFSVTAKPRNENQGELLWPSGGRAKYTLKKQNEFDYMVNWIRLALSVPFSQTDFDKANYSYAEAFRDIADGTVQMNRLDDSFEIEAGMFDDIALGKYTDGELSFNSKAAQIAEVAARVHAGELPRTQLNTLMAEAIDTAPDAAGLRERYLPAGYREARGFAGSLKHFYSENISSGLNLARQSAGYKNVFGVLTTYTQRKNRLIADAVERQLSTWVHGDATQADKTTVSAALLKRTTGEYKVGEPEYEALRAALSQRQREMFDQATKMIADRLDAELKADAVTYRALLEDDEAFNEWYENRAAQVEQLKANGYFPERRYGDHVVHGFITAPDGRKFTAYYSQHEREADAQAELEQMQKTLGGDSGLSFEYGYRYKADYDGSISFAQFLDLANRHGISLTQAEKQRIGKALVSADSTRRNRIFRRQNVAGYSEDGMRVLAEFGVTMANKIAYAELGVAINDAMAGRQVETAFDTRGEVQVTTQAGTNVWNDDGPQGGFYRNLADQTVDFVMSPQEGSALSRGLRLGASVQFLGGSVASAMVQLTSLPMNTIPWLTQQTSYTDAFGKTLDGMRVAFKHFSAIKDLPTLLDISKPMEGIDEVEGLRRGLQIAAQDGTILDTEIYQIMGLSRGQEYSLSGRVQTAVKLWMTPFRLSEQMNRMSTFIAAYKVAKDKKFGDDEAYKFAQETVYSTQFRYDEANRPAAARGPVGALLFTFKTYPIFMLETMAFLAKESPRSAAFMIGSLVMMAGIEGLPFAEDIEDLIDTIAQRVFGAPFNSKRWLRNTLKTASEAVVGADLSAVFMHGAANTLTELSFASRVGMGNLIPGTRIGAADADYKRVMGEILGPVGSLVQGALGGVDSMSRGQFTEAARQALPLAGQNFVKGVQAWEKGFATDIGGRKLVDVGGWEAFWQALGFSSNAVTAAYEADRIDKQTSAFYTQVKQDIQKELVKAIQAKDEPRMREATNAIAAWNAAHSDMPMSISGASVRRQAALAGMPITQRGYLSMPRGLRSGSEAALGLDD